VREDQLGACVIVMIDLAFSEWFPDVLASSFPPEPVVTVSELAVQFDRP
jgi:hypothetical protein